MISRSPDDGYLSDVLKERYDFIEYSSKLIERANRNLEQEIRKELYKLRTHRLNIRVHMSQPEFLGSEGMYAIRMHDRDSYEIRIQQKLYIERIKPRGWVAPLPG